MSVSRDTSSSSLLPRLEAGWRAEHPDAPRDLLAVLRTGLTANVVEQNAGKDLLRFTIELSNVRMHGAHSLPGVVLGGAGPWPETLLRDFWSAVKEPGRHGLVIASSEAAIACASDGPRSRCAIISSSDLRNLIASPRPIDALKTLLRAQIPLLRLVPFNTMLPAQEGMFFGRRSELNLLHYEEESSFAIAGPSKIGKSSLMQQYRRELRRNGDSRTHRLHEIDFLDYRGADDDALARFIAMRIHNCSRSDHMTLNDFPQFFYAQRAAAGGPLELLFDEVDEVCSTEAFTVLADAVRHKLVRMILGGKGQLLRTMNNPKHILAGRLNLIRPAPLEKEAARALLLEPLRDLGIEIAESDALTEQVFSLTARLPHLIQSCGKKLVEYAVEKQLSAITPAHLDEVRQDFLSMVYSTAALKDLQDDYARLIALLLLQVEPREINVSIVLDLAKREGVEIAPMQAKDILDDLVICNILLWDRERYVLASPGLAAYMRRMGILRPELERVREALHRRDHATI